MAQSDPTEWARKSPLEQPPQDSTGTPSVLASEEPPLVVDLDGTVIRTDLKVEAIITLVKRSPIEALRILRWLLRGRAVLKRELARRVTIDVETLPYRDEFCRYLKGEASRGRRLILATASDEIFAGEIAKHLGIFERVIASDGVVNLKGRRKRDRLVHELGEHGFDYAGDSRADLAVWSAARTAIVVGGSRWLRAAAARRTTVEPFLENRAGTRLPAWLRALRPQHWIKNVLVFLPVVATYRADELALIGSSVLAFSALCLAASSSYVLNDLLDLEADRRHPKKRERPIPSGDLPLRHAIVMAPLLLVGAFLLAARLPAPFPALLALYCGLTMAYSLRIKHVVLLDVIVLTGLYMLRILAGAAATDIAVTRWLLAFVLLAFLSLAVLKRYTEIVMLRAGEGGPTQVRGYSASDKGLLMAIGVAGGLGATVILALNPTSPTFDPQYKLGWLFCGVYLYWIGRLWLLAERNLMPFDPVLFAFKDRTSQVLIAVMAVLILVAQ